MATFKEQEPGFLDRSTRATRGKRMTKLLDEETEEDEQFWNQDALKELFRFIEGEPWCNGKVVIIVTLRSQVRFPETVSLIAGEEDDTNYEEEREVADVFDSDFDEDEPEPDEEAENDADHRERKKKRLVYPGKPVKKKKNKIKVLSKLEKTIKDEPLDSEQPSPSDNHDNTEDLESERIVRKSTRTSVIVRQAERDAIRAAVQATMKPIKRKKEGEEKRMTQEDMLIEAAQTEIINLRNLERVLAREEEVKKRAVVQKAVYSGPQIRYSSKDGKSFLEFSNGLSFESEICTTSTPYPQKAVCAITGLPAKYRDPKTGLPYATKEAFKIIRERFLEENSKLNKKKDMGTLFNSISGQGFPAKRKRSEIGNRDETSCQRYFARFRSIPALENQERLE